MDGSRWRRSRTWKLATLVVIAASAPSALSCAGADERGLAPSRSTVEVREAVSAERGSTGPNRLACTGVEEPTNFRQISLGRSFQGLELTTILRVCSIGDPARRLAPPNTLSYIYGSCEPGPGEGGCAPPVEVSVAPACVRSPALYPGRIDAAALPRRRGVPVLSRDGGRRLELVTGRESVVIHADSPARAWAAIGALRAAARGSSPSDLPARSGEPGPPKRLAPPAVGRRCRPVPLLDGAKASYSLP